MQSPIANDEIGVDWVQMRRIMVRCFFSFFFVVVVLWVTCVFVDLFAFAIFRCSVGLYLYVIWSEGWLCFVWLWLWLVGFATGPQSERTYGTTRHSPLHSLSPLHRGSNNSLDHTVNRHSISPPTAQIHNLTPPNNHTPPTTNASERYFVPFDSDLNNNSGQNARVGRFTRE